MCYARKAYSESGGMLEDSILILSQGKQSSDAVFNRQLAEFKAVLD